MLLFDEMLKKLCRWFRILGVDSAYAKGLSDREIEEWARREGRVIITKDKELGKRPNAVFLESEEIASQIAEVIKKTGVKVAFPNRTRCPLCNRALVEKGEKRWECPNCGKEYWVGSHWKNITKVYEQVRKTLKITP